MLRHTYVACLVENNWDKWMDIGDYTRQAILCKQFDNHDSHECIMFIFTVIYTE